MGGSELGAPKESAGGERVWLPPGQTATAKFPVTGERAPDRVLTRENWRLEVGGAIGRPGTWTWADLMGLPQETFCRNIHCVTGWSQRAMEFRGVRLWEVVKACGPVRAEATHVRFAAYSSRGHDTSLPLEVALEDSWLVYEYDGRPLTEAHGFPVRVVTPGRYFYKSVKWLREISFMEGDRLGFWERTSGYDNVGDPWLEQRFEGRRFTSREEAERFRHRENFDGFRGDAGEVILKADLRGWKPRTSDLRQLRMKACDFRGADLRGVDLRGANLTLGKFAGACLEGANLGGADLEGSDFCEARMAGALLMGNALSAAVFHREHGVGLASFAGMRVCRPSGLLESQERYLADLGVLVSE